MRVLRCPGAERGSLRDAGRNYQDGLAFGLSGPTDIIEAGEAITVAVGDLSFAAYGGSRLVRSSIEREFIIIGDAVAALVRW